MALDFPNSPTLNQVFNSGDGRSWTWTGTTWDAVLTEAPAGANGQDGKYIVSDTAPSSPEAGDGWFDSTAGKFFIYYDSFWVEFGTATGPQGPSGTDGTDGVDGVDGGFDTAQTVQEIPLGDWYDLVAADAGKLFLNNTAGGVEVRITTSTALPVGAQIDFIQTSTSQLLFSPGAGVTLNSKNNNTRTAARYSPATIKCVATNSYVLVGDLAA